MKPEDKWWLKYASSLATNDYELFLRTMTEKEFSNIPEYLLLGISKLKVVDVCEFWFYYEHHNTWPTLETARQITTKHFKGELK